MKPDKIHFSLFLLIFFTAFSWITSCKHTADITDLPEVCFGRDVLPVFLNSCAITNCHDGQGESELVLLTYTDIIRGVVPGKPDASRIYNAITATWGENKMPPDQPLTLTNRTLIRLWIEQGASQTTCQQTGQNNTDVQK